MNKYFKIGDIIKGKSKFYTVTNDKMKKAIVEKVDGIYSIKIKIIDHEIQEHIGKQFWVNNSNEDFSLFSEKDFKVGDIIKGKENNGYSLFNDNLLKAEIIEIFEDDTMKIKILSHTSSENKNWIAVVKNSKSKFELIKEGNKKMNIGLKDFKNGMVVEYRNEWKRVYIDGLLYKMEFNNNIISSKCNNICYKENLTSKIDSDLDIMKIYKDFRGELIWERKEEEIDWSKVEVDTPLMVKFFEDSEPVKRHFAKYENNKVYVWENGKTSFTTIILTKVYSAKLIEQNKK